MAHDVTAPAVQRLRRLLNQRVRPHIVTSAQPMLVQASVEMFDSVPFETVASLELRPFFIGESWGRPWHTVWFKLTADVPTASVDHQYVAHIDLGFSGRGDGFQAEGMAWQNGRRLQAVQPDRRLIPLDLSTANSGIEMWIEAAATPIIAGHESGYGPTALGDPLTAGDSALYALRRAEIGVFNSDVSDLAVLLHATMDLIIDLNDRDPQRDRLFAIIEELDRVLDPTDVPGTAARAIEFLHQQFRSLPGNVGGDDTHRIIAAGHAHLDTAWLWPLRETRRKAVRTFVNAVGLLRRNPDVVFSHSQAQHYAWVETDAPEVFEAVRTLVANRQWEPVGGMWVETDLNLPAGESLLRQFVQGQRAFLGWFGEHSKVAFLPDDFGYPGSLPQIVKHAGGQWFFSQKMSWNETNTFPHHSFWWEGIDGSRLFTHFSPVETYNALLTPSQMRFASRNFLDHRGASQSLALYGHGDGGGGPTQEMVDRGRLSRVLPSIPRVEFGSVAHFFQTAQAEYAAQAPVWVGEMYLEKHRGTYSSQIQTKQGNRTCERLLHELELWSAAAGVEQPELPGLWQRVLTQQFHDIIPGSSIAWVHRDTEDEHREVANTIENLLTSLLASPKTERVTRSESSFIVDVLNPAPVSRQEVIVIDGQPTWVDVAAFSQVAVNSHEAVQLPDTVQSVSYVIEPSGSITATNGIISYTIDVTGSLSHFLVNAARRNVIGPLHQPRHQMTNDAVLETGQLIIRRDMPAEYDAWDIDQADADRPGIRLRAIRAPEVTVESLALVRVSTHYEFGASSFTLHWIMRAGSPRLDLRLEADWQGSEERLQWVMPVNVLAREAMCGIQFGHVRRARHQNTPWDAARFEVCGHRYVYVNEPGCGVGILADGPRGYDIRNHDLALTLLRAPQFPDPHCDVGLQTIEWSLYADQGAADMANLEAEAARLAYPVRVTTSSSQRAMVPVSLAGAGLQISAVKLADDNSGDLIVRLWECRGARSPGHLRLLGSPLKVVRCNALEEPSKDEADVLIRVDENSNTTIVELDMAPFEIRTYRVRTKNSASEVGNLNPLAH